MTIEQNIELLQVSKKHVRLTLRQLLQRNYSIVICLLLMLVETTILLRSLSAIRRYAENNMELVESLISYNIRAAVLADDHRSIREVLSIIDQRKQIAEIRVYGVKYNLLASWKSETIGQASPAQKVIANWLFPKPMIAPILHNQHEIGHIWLNGDLRGLTHFIFLMLLWLTSSLLIMIVGASYLSYRKYSDINTSHRIRKQQTFSQQRLPSTVAQLNELSKKNERLKKENNSLTWLSQHDQLTGLLNRSTFQNELTTSIESRSECKYVGVLFIDADHFKEVNDKYGHAAGDYTLITVAQRLRSALRNDDSAARIGGDEFAVLVTNIEAVHEVERFARRIVDAMTKPIDLPDGTRIYQSVSIGIVLSKEITNAQKLLAQADAAMYRIKRRGGGWYWIFNAEGPDYADD
ncbi:unnamed protein product [Adineta ricciae]|uniref:GGDEF domain-containing protein n=1 Tax=Adineta ricciae TaxID=249248 RepID=A0A815YFI7_ADIRI|nr:unnamed protein product [Adineta ricciae]